MIFPYPFNHYGFIDKIEMPIKNFFWKLECFKNIYAYPWDCVNIHEDVFARFEFFCKTYPFYFVDQAACESRVYEYHKKNIDPEADWDDMTDEQYKSYLRLAQIQEYVLYTRKLNQEKYDYICECWHKSWTSKFIPSDHTFNGEKCSEWISEHAYYYNVDWWFENGELMYTMEKVLEKGKYFNPLDIEDYIQKVGTAYAKEILDLSGYIWN